MNMIKRFCRDRAGATAIEYALIAGFISLAVIGGATAIGGTLNATFAEIVAGF
jgi:pilus assembly protein Flp/PilA